jgi:hypothetical protein
MLENKLILVKQVFAEIIQHNNQRRLCGRLAVAIRFPKAGQY